MAKKNLFSKIFGKGDSDCCSVSFEQAPETGSSEGRQDNGPQEEEAETEERQETANKDR